MRRNINKRMLIGISVAVVLMFVATQFTGSVNSHTAETSSNTPSVGIPVNLTLHSGMKIFAVGANMSNMLTISGISSKAVTLISQNEVDYTTNGSIVVFNNSAITHSKVSSIELGNLFRKGDLIAVHSQNRNKSKQAELDLGIAWAKNFHSRVLIFPNVPIPGGTSFVMASGNLQSLAISPVSPSHNSMVARMNSWFTQSPPLTTQTSSIGSNNVMPASTPSGVQNDPVQYIDYHLPSGAYLFHSGAVLGYSSSNLSYVYDIGLYIEPNTGTDGPYTVISMQTVGYIQIGLNHGGEKINSMKTDFNYINSYNDYSTGFLATTGYWDQGNSYFFSNGGYYSPTQTTGTTSYTFSDSATSGPSFSYTYTPPAGNVNVATSQTKQTESSQTYGSSEVDQGWTFTYSKAGETSGYYRAGQYAGGNWKLQNGKSNENTAYMQMTQNIKVRTKETHPYLVLTKWYFTNIDLNATFYAIYNPTSSGWSAQGGYNVYALGPNYNGKVSYITYTTQEN